MMLGVHLHQLEHMPVGSIVCARTCELVHEISGQHRQNFPLSPGSTVCIVGNEVLVGSPQFATLSVPWTAHLATFCMLLCHALAAHRVGMRGSLEVSPTAAECRATSAGCFGRGLCT